MPASHSVALALRDTVLFTDSGRSKNLLESKAEKGFVFDDHAAVVMKDENPLEHAFLGLLHVNYVNKVSQKLPL